MTESLSTFAITSTLPKEYKKPSATKTLSASPLSIKKYEGLYVEPRSPSLTREVVEYEGGEDGDTEAITKEEEWITKKKTELTTTRQIETRVKRNVVLEDGKVIEDSGPIVSTNTTEDTDKQETETTERKDIGGTDENDQIPAIQFGGTGNDLVSAGSALGTALANFGGKPVTKLVPRPVDGLVRETNEKRVVSREEIKERVEVEDVAHLGDFSDEAYLRAVNSGAENLEEVLYSPENQKQLIPLGPQIVHQSIKGRKVVDTEDVQKRCLAQDDGTLVTEQKKTTEHEEFYDQDLPEKDDHSTGSQEQIQTTESSQRYFKQRDEQNVDYVADGKLVGQEMRYAAETEQMERDGPPERPEDWDSLSDRIRKSRLKPKTLLQQQKEAILGDRKDALTKRPLDFDREEETRKGETMKWLESHFGSESTTSSDSRENDDVEPTKKSYFNVTIKSNQNGNTSTLSRPSPAKAVVPQEPLPSPIATKPQTQQLSQNGKTKYFQGISNWADRRESTPKQLVSKAFKDELSGTLERNKNLRQISSSRDDLRYAARNNKAADTYVSKEDIMQQKRSHYNNFGSRTDLRYRRQSRDDSGDELKKEDLGYLSGSRTDLRRDRRDSNEEGRTRKAHNLKREDSGYVKDSREDVRSSLLREEESNSKISNGGKSIIQRDDSAYISSSTNFTEPNQRLPKTSPARASSPEFQGRPSVPQRRRVIEKKLRQTNSNYSPPSPIRNIDRSEPPPDYSPPPRSSRSRSPPAIIIPPAPAPPINGTLPSTARKSNQRTRFASESSSKPTASTQTQTTPPKSGSKVGQAIGNSIRKLVGKIRSASADRKFRMKSKSKSRDRSPSPSNNGNNSIHSNGPNSTTYQQYNVIDSHISGGSNSNHHQPQQPTSVLKSSKSAPLNRESSIISSSMTNGRGADRRGSSDLDIMANGGANPKQRYYLGEDPYGGSIFGKENKYDKNGKLQRRREGSSDEMPVNNNHRETYVRQQPNLSSSNTLGRYQKSYNTSTSNYYNSRLGSTPNLGADYDYRSAQTLPRKLDHSNQNGNNYFQNRPPQHHSSTINVSFVNQVKSQPLQNTGPAKPARMYSSKPQLNRSKSFNVHGLNGTNDPNPIFIGKSRNHYNRGETMYKSNPALYHTSSQQQDTFANGLKSPSIVNLISRSQKDLTRIGEDEPPVDFRKEKRMSHMNKKDVFLKGLQDQAPELYRTIHGGSASPVVNGRHYKHPSSSLGSRSPIEINKDTASIIRRGSSSTETDYTETYKYTTKNDDPKRPTVTNTVQSFTKKTVPTKDGRGLETIHSQEKKSVTTSRFKNEPISNLKYYDDRRRRSGSSNLGGGTTVIEVRRK